MLIRGKLLLSAGFSQDAQRALDSPALVQGIMDKVLPLLLHKPADSCRKIPETQFGVLPAGRFLPREHPSGVKESTAQESCIFRLQGLPFSANLTELKAGEARDALAQVCAEQIAPALPVGQSVRLSVKLKWEMKPDRFSEQTGKEIQSEITVPGTMSNEPTDLSHRSQG